MAMKSLNQISRCIIGLPAGIVGSIIIYGDWLLSRIGLVIRGRSVTTLYAIGSNPLSGVPPMKPKYPPSSEATAINPKTCDVITSQTTNQ
jgi:hypothetical protein